MGCRHATDARAPTSAATCNSKSSARSDAAPPKPPPSRAELISSVFHACDTGDDDHLNCLELMRFASLVDYLDSPEAWTKNYDWMCAQFGWVPEVGPDIGAFTRLVDNDDAAGFYRTTSELRRLLRELLELSKLDAEDDWDEESSSSGSSTHLSRDRGMTADSAQAAERHLRAIKRRKTKQKKRMVRALSKAHRSAALEVVEKLLFHGLDTLLQEDGEVSALHCAVGACGLLEGGDSDLRRLISDFGISRGSTSQLLHNESDSEGNEEATAKPGMRRKVRKVGHNEGTGSLAKKALVRRKLPSKAASALPLGQSSPRGHSSPRGEDRETSQQDRPLLSGSMSALLSRSTSSTLCGVSPERLHSSTMPTLLNGTSTSPLLHGTSTSSLLDGSTPVGRPRAETEPEPKEGMESVNVQLMNDIEDSQFGASLSLDLMTRAVSLPLAPGTCSRSKKTLLRRHHTGTNSRGSSSIPRNTPIRGHRRENTLKNVSLDNIDENPSPRGDGDTVKEADERQQLDHYVSEQPSAVSAEAPFASIALTKSATETVEFDSDHSNEGQELQKVAKAKAKKAAKPARGSKANKARAMSAEKL